MNFVAAGALLLAALPGVAMAGENCSLKLLTTAEAELGPDNLLLVHAKINNQPVLMIVDTGAAVSLMFEGGVERLGLPVSSFPEVISGVDGRRLTTKAQISLLEIGSQFRSRTHSFPISPSSGLHGDVEVAGLLGADYLSNYDLEIDLPEHKINLFYQDHCPGKWCTGVIHIMPPIFMSKLWVKPRSRLT